MSKQSTANYLYEGGVSRGEARKEIIGNISRNLGIGVAYASTLYQKAKKTHTSTQTSHTKPEAKGAFEKSPVRSSAKVTAFNKANLRELRVDFQTAIDAVAAKHGLTGKLGNIRFGATDFTCKMTVETSGAGAVKDDRKEADFRKYAVIEGLSADDFGKEFTYMGKTLTIVGYNTRAKKYPISLKDTNGKGFKVAGIQIAYALGH